MEIGASSGSDPSGDLVKTRFVEFLQHFVPQDVNHLDERLAQQRLMFDYMAQLEVMIQSNRSTLYVDFQHLMEMDSELAEAIELEYYRFDPFLRAAVHDIVSINNKQYIYDIDRGRREFFVAFYNLPVLNTIRSIRTESIGKLVAVSGTVTRSSEVRPELLYGTFLCTNCGTIAHGIEQQFQFTEPQVCKNSQCGVKGKFQLIVDSSLFVDWQRLRVQENADEIPPGSMPRCLDIICRNEMVEVAKAGDKVIFVGTLAVSPDSSGLARAGESSVVGKSFRKGDIEGSGVQGLQRFGVREMTYRMFFVAASIQVAPPTNAKPSSGIIGNSSSSHAAYLRQSILPLIEGKLGGSEGAGGQESPDRKNWKDLTDAEIHDILRMKATPNLYSRMADSICPAVFGHTEVKRGVLLMLFGGVHKVTTEGISLRGDLNVCIVGDPSCAKSQFLKYVHEFWPRTVYTAGKSSSAAGLTASVVRDGETGEFCVEAGALMLADNGICCIDEFDKMDPTDQVAIHEAMEQQTISITKAGIQATLNARTSILAAANPVFGRYDRTKTLKANVTISAPIMSRFDLFFVILDECNPVSDEAIARHILKNHRVLSSESMHLENQASNDSSKPSFSPEQLRRYIQFARGLNPVITAESAKVLIESYRLLRQNDLLGKNKTAYRITVRQLESLVRLSEALARLHLDDKIQPAYVKEAYRLLQKSIIFVESEDVELDDDDVKDASPHSSSASSTHVDDNQSVSVEEAADQSALSSTTPATVAHSSTTSTSIASASIDPGSEAPEANNDLSKTSTTPRQPFSMTSTQYEAMTHALAYRLSSLEKEKENDGEPWQGCPKNDLVQWYLKEFHEELTDVQAFDERVKVLNKVIRRMIRHEGTIIVVEDSQLLRLHPSVQL